MLDFKVWSSDVKLAYLQSTKHMKLLIFIKDPALELIWMPTSVSSYSDHFMV